MSSASFASLGLHPDLLRTLAQRGHLRPTPIQAAAIPAALAGRDLIGAAVTGLLCIPWVLASEAYGWSQRPAHLLQSFIAIPIAFLSSGIFLWLRSPEGAPAWERRLAWAVWILSGLWVLMLAWVFVALSRGMFPAPA